MIRPTGENLWKLVGWVVNGGLRKGLPRKHLEAESGRWRPALAAAPLPVIVTSEDIFR
jgi:hypothetical protein